MKIGLHTPAKELGKEFIRVRYFYFLNIIFQKNLGAAAVKFEFGICDFPTTLTQTWGADGIFNFSIFLEKKYVTGLPSSVFGGSLFINFEKIPVCFPQILGRVELLRLCATCLGRAPTPSNHARSASGAQA